MPSNNKQVVPGNLYRAKLGISISRELKKSPPVVYRPGVGYQKPTCCVIPPPIIRTTIDGGSPYASGLKIIDGNGGASIIDGGKP